MPKRRTIAALRANSAQEGIGLCRTEHMFFDAARITAVREMILADSEKGPPCRARPLAPRTAQRLRPDLPIMAGLPVTIRLLDPPLHEFLPQTEGGFRRSGRCRRHHGRRLRRRATDLHEFNPMLGHRGCRLGITYPEIYEMQARAIFEAAVAVAAEAGAAPIPKSWSRWSAPAPSCRSSSS
jgi:pyruvate,orthophosphate dikinase